MSSTLPDSSLMYRCPKKSPSFFHSPYTMLATIIAQNITIGIFLVVYTALPEQAMIVFGVTKSQLILTASALPAGVFLGGIKNMLFVSRFSLKAANNLYLLLQLTACLVRVLSFDNFFYAFLAQFIQGLSNSMLIMSIMRFFQNWFNPEKTRLLIPFVSTAAFIGNVIGVGFPALLIDTSSKDLETLRPQFQLLYCVYFGWVIALVLFSLFIFKDQPADFVKTSLGIESSYLDEIKTVVKKFEFWKYGVLVGLSRAVLINLFGSLAMILTTIKADSRKTFPILLLFLVFGFLGTFFYNKVLSRKYEGANFTIFIACSTLFLNLSIIAAYYNQFYLFYGSLVIVGFFFVNQMPISMSYAMSSLKVKNVTFVNSVYFLLAQVLAFGGNTLFSWLLATTAEPGMAFLSCISVMGLLSIAFSL